MKTLRNLIIGLSICAGIDLHAQTWSTFGNFVIPGDFIGSINDEFFDIRQNNVRRARFQNVNWPGYNAAPALNNANRIHFPVGNNNQVPFSMMHLGYDTPAGLQRPWMNVGTTYGAGNDIMYTGIIQSPGDSDNALVIDAVVAWGCNDDIFAPWNGPDNLRFLFLAPTNQTASPGSAPEGLETMRITPWGHVGIGSGFSNALQPVRRLDVFDSNTDAPQFRISHDLDNNPNQGSFADFQVFSTGNIHIRPALNDVTQNVAIGFLPVTGNPATNPTERIDVLGTARLREMLSNEADVLITGVQQSAAGDYALNYLSFTGDNSEVLAGDGSWVDISNFGCEWNIIPNATTGDNDLVMGYPGACNEGFVRIGNATNFGGFQPRMTLESNSNSNAGLFSFVQGEIGIGTLTQGTIWQTVGILSRTLTTEGRSIGVLGISGSNSNVMASIGVAGVSSTSGPSYGLYGEGSTAALYLVGNTVSSGQSFGLSDMNFKTNLTDEVPGISELMLLTPKAYQFKSDEFPHMKMPTGTHYGLIAQEVQEYHPQLVREFEKPEIIDNETGEIISPGEEYLALDYVSLIPILIKSIQEQQSMIEAQQAQIEMLTEMVGDCCNASKSNAHPPAGENLMNGFRLDVERPTLNQNSPNPFTSSTLITYYLPKATFARLRVVNTSGQTIEVLTEGQQSEGEYRVVWNGDQLAPGTYIYILEADGVEIAKRAIKMN